MNVKMLIAILVYCVAMHISLYAKELDTTQYSNTMDNQRTTLPQVYCTIGWNTLIGLYLGESNGRQPFFQNLTGGATFRWKTSNEQFQFDIGAFLISSAIIHESQNKIFAFGRVTDIVDFKSYTRLYTLEVPLTFGYQIYNSGSNALVFRMGTSLGVGLHSKFNEKVYLNGDLFFEQKDEGRYPIPNNGFSLAFTGGIEYQFSDALFQVFYSRRTDEDFPRQIHLLVGYRIF